MKSSSSSTSWYASVSTVWIALVAPNFGLDAPYPISSDHSPSVALG